MKQYMLHIPAMALAAFAVIWLGHGRKEATALRAAVDLRRAELAPRPITDDRPAVVAEDEAGALLAGDPALQAELRRIEEATNTIREKTAELKQRIPAGLDAEVTESLGRITDMGAEIGRHLRAVSMDADEADEEREQRGITADDPGRIVMASRDKIATWAREISAMEDTPPEIASLQSSALRETFALSDTQTRQAQAIIQAHFTMMKAAGLTYASHDAPEWQERREASLTGLLRKLRPLIPANSKRISNLSWIVNIGSGMDPDDGH